MPRDDKTDRDPEVHGLDAESPTATEGPEAATEGFGAGEAPLVVGQNLGGRYQVVGRLGAGGMGEVWRAFDLKLRVEVALKALRQEVFKDEKRLEMLRQEVRAAREVVSPNVCRIFDLVEADGRELVSMEYVDGDTLLEVLQERGPLELKQAQDIASQFLAGLEAIHTAGLVHRDVKPENIMVTRAGRVVLMDFGLARQQDSGAGTVVGTPAYMAPEQAAGTTVDARADVYSAGVVLAEMVSPEGIKSLESRKSVWEGVRSEPAKLPDTPWAPVLKKAVAKEPEQRYNSAHTLTRALEDVTLRVEGAEDLHPYPGLASFTEEDAEYFFGREAEVEQMWRTLERPHLLALIGPSGAGKSSFIRAGLLPAAPPGWSCLVCTPGNVPVLSLGRALARAMAGDAGIVEQMLSFDDQDVAVDVVSRWRGRAGDGLLVVDQFEELFTQNEPDVQRRFAELLARIAIEADVHVLLCMRDDFLFRCSDQPALTPVFSELTPLRPPMGDALRRALVQPAMKCGYRFEDDELVDQMLAEVEGERGALPLLAFAMARLWEKRDRENGLLTRQAYYDIGGVGGALARHAEETIDRIGSDRLGMVREIFRNLITAEGTRSVRERDELLSVFRDSRSESRAEEVLRQLVDARLLTSYEVPEADEEPTRRVEIIHESLLANWPRLVRWQTQDADAAQLRDQLRQAARTWDEHARSDDLLWTGSAYREFAVWREQYPGGLSETEGAFAQAMTSYATRRKRRRRIAVAAVLAIVLTVTAFTTVLWRRSVLQERRAEAQKLIALGQLELERNPSAAVAHAITSLELSDSAESRLLALEALWRGPTALVVNEDDTAWNLAFGADGRWLVQSVSNPQSEVRIIRNDGSAVVLERVHDASQILFAVSPRSDIIVTWDRHDRPSHQHIVLWSAPEGRRLGDVWYREDVTFWPWDLGWRESSVLLPILEKGRAYLDAVDHDGNRSRLGEIGAGFDVDGVIQSRDFNVAIDRQTGRWLGRVTGNDVVVHRISDDCLGPPRRLGRHEGRVTAIQFDPLGRYLATANEAGEIRLWDPSGVSLPVILDGPGGTRYISLSKDGSLLYAVFVEDEDEKVWMWSVTDGEPRLLRRFDIGKYEAASFKSTNPVMGYLARAGRDRKIRVWPFSAPADADPLILGRDEIGQLWTPAFDDKGEWLAAASPSGLTLYPLARPYPAVMHHETKLVHEVAFAPDGSWFASSGSFEAIRVWPLEGRVPPPARVPYEDRPICMALSPEGTHLLIGTIKDKEKGDVLLSLDNGSRTLLNGFQHYTTGVAFSPDGRLAAGAGGAWEERENLIRVWDVESGKELRVLVPTSDLREWTLQFLSETEIVAITDEGLRKWDVETGQSALLVEGNYTGFAISDGLRALLPNESNPSQVLGTGVLTLLEFSSGIATPLAAHGNRINSFALDRTGTLVATGDVDGIVRVGPVTGEQPHLLLGHETTVNSLAFDPLNRYLASGGEDGTVRLWPMPDLSKPPLHTLPREELIAKLKTLTNLRAVRDEESATGWKLTHDPFPGWETVPSW